MDTAQTPTEVLELAEAYLKAKQNLVLYRHILLNNTNEADPASFHFDWSRELLSGKEHVAIEGFRESAKDQYVSRSFPLYALTYPSARHDYIVIIRNNDTQAQKDITNISNEYFSNALLQANHVKTVKKSANSLSIVAKDESGQDISVLIEGYGKGASVRGLAMVDKRPKIVIINDIQDIEDSRSDTVQEKDWEWFLSDVMFLGQYTRIFMIGNNLGEKCTIERVFANAKGLGFNTYKVPILIDDKPSWPSKYTIAQIQKERDSFTELGKLEIWLRERMCIAVSDETRIFRDSDYVYFTPALSEKIASGAQEVYATLDPASSKSAESCFRAIVVNARMQDGHWYIVDVRYGRWDSVELLHQMFDVVRLWGVRRFGIEKGHFQQVLEPFIYKEMTRLGIRFVIQPLEHAKAGTKLERIKMLQPRFRAKTIWFPQEAPWLTEMKTELAGVTNLEIKSLYIDLVDALAMCEQMDTGLGYGIQPEANRKNLPRMAIR
jgi:predicted phage terminase large subunit-like protein